MKAPIALLGAAALAIGGLSLPWRGDRPAEPPRLLASARGTGPIRAGAASVDFDLPPGVPIGGYARLSWRSSGLRDAVGARAIFLEVPGFRAAILSADQLLVSEALVRRVEELVAPLRLDAILVGATHTHAGPGGYREELAFELAALGPWNPRVFDRLAERMAEAVRLAAEGAGPARLAIARGDAAALVKARSGGRVDGRMASLRLSGAGGAPLAELLVFAAHPAILGKENRRLSGEWPGRFAAIPGRGVRVVLQGAIGDQSVRQAPGPDATAVERYAAAVAERDDALPAAPEIAETTLAAASASVVLPPPAPAAVPRWLRRAAATVAWNQIPATARVTALRVGGLTLVAVPAEPTGGIGAAWRTALGGDVEIVSLVNGYAGYVDDAERIRRGEGEAVRSYYGPELAERLQRGVELAAEAVRR